MNIEPSGQLRVSVVTHPHSLKQLYKVDISIFLFIFKHSTNITEKTYLKYKKLKISAYFCRIETKRQ